MSVRAHASVQWVTGCGVEMVVGYRWRIRGRESPPEELLVAEPMLLTRYALRVELRFCTILYGSLRSLCGRVLKIKC